MGEVVRSLYFQQDEILQGIRNLYCPNGFQCDVTYGNGGFYKRLPEPKYKFDLEPLSDDVVPASSDNLPLADGSLGNMVFDPPFLTYVKNARSHKDGAVVMTKRFGGYWAYSELEDHYRDTLKEASRVLEKKGILVMKCQDIIHNHRMHCTHSKTINWAAEYGLRLKDLFVLGAKHRMPSPQKGTQRHARVWHCYFLVFENTQRTVKP